MDALDQLPDRTSGQRVQCVEAVFHLIVLKVVTVLNISFVNLFDLWFCEQGMQLLSLENFHPCVEFYLLEALDEVCFEL